jgi:hypothetical protein
VQLEIPVQRLKDAANHSRKAAGDDPISDDQNSLHDSETALDVAQVVNLRFVSV